jgi:hypothetical protein
MRDSKSAEPAKQTFDLLKVNVPMEKEIQIPTFSMTEVNRYRRAAAKMKLRW